MSGAAADFPGRFPVLIGTRAFNVNTSYEQFRRQSTHHDTIPSQRESIDLTDLPGQGTINTEGLWRRGQLSWHHGSGQLYLDRKDSDDFRFYDSKGVDPWNQNQLTLLPDTVERVADGTTYNWCTTQVAGAYVYHLQANANPAGVCRVRYTTDYATWTTPTGFPTTNMFEIATDGNKVYAGGNSGVYVTDVGGSSWTQIISDEVDHIFCCGDRVIVTIGPAAWDITYNPSGGTTLGEAGFNFMTPPDPLWDWLDATAGESFIYMAGVSGSPGGQVGRSVIFQVTIPQPSSQNNATQSLQLAYGAPALYLDAGEFCGTIYAYEGYVLVGTNLGIRLCRPSTLNDPTVSSGLVKGPLVPNQTHPVQAPFQPYIGNFVSGIVGYERWIWFSWPQFDGSSWGLGRLDLGNLLADLQPAYASDLMVASTSTSDNSHHTLNWCPITNGPLIVVPQQGLYTQDFNSSISDAVKYVASGTLRSGRLTYDISDMKTVAQANLKLAAANAYAPFDTGEGTAALNVSYDGAGFISLAPLAPNTQANPPTLVSPLTVAEEIEIEAVLTAGSVSNADDSRPFLTRWTVKALPNVVSGIFIYVALMLYVQNEANGDLDFSDPYGDYAYLENLRLSQEIIEYKEASTIGTQFTATCVVQELYWMPQQKRDNADGGYEGDLVVTLKSIVG